MANARRKLCSPRIKRLIDRGGKRMTIMNAIGLAKSAIGDCADELPHLKISKKLWELVEMLYEISFARRK